MREALDLSHVRGDLPTMVDVSHKPQTFREATAEARVLLPSWITGQVFNQDVVTKKGPVFATAIIAGTMAAKNTSSLIPFCHELMIEHVDISVAIKKPEEVVILCTVKTNGRTGVEMEALTGASVAALTVYDMCKSLSTDITISEIRLLEKRGGKHDLCRK
jgi:cyclic pyranopterin phosphate synthase